MKKKLNIVLFYLVFLFITCTAVAQTSVHTDRNIIKQRVAYISGGASLGFNKQALNKFDFSDTMYKMILQIHRRVTTCPEDMTGTGRCAYVSTQNCGVNYCNDQKCIDKILCCHEILESEFNYMTDNQNTYYGEFSRSAFRDVVRDADCSSDRIRCSLDNEYVYLERLANNGTPAGADEAYYSVALMQAIDNYKTIRYVRIFNGIIIDTTSSKQIIPVMVKFTDGTIKYFDVSDTQP